MNPICHCSLNVTQWEGSGNGRLTGVSQPISLCLVLKFVSSLNLEVGLHRFIPPMPHPSRLHAPVLWFEYPNVVQSNVLLYYKFIRVPHVIFDQFVCIAQEDYWRILNHVEKNTHKVEEEGEIVMVKEHRELDRSGTRKGHIVIKVSEFNAFQGIFYLSNARQNKQFSVYILTVDG